MRTAYLNLLLRPYGCYTPFSGRFQSILVKSPLWRTHHTFSGNSLGLALARRRPFFVAVAISGVGLGLTSLSWPRIHCDTTPKLSNTSQAQPAPDDALPPLPTSSVSFYQLGFGTVAGICAGVFVKKGVKAAAWLLGGIFVLLQYLNSASFIRVDWPRINSRFEAQFNTTEADGSKKPPTLRSLWSWLINFLTADFQPRASFIAGFALGLRMG